MLQHPIGSKGIPDRPICLFICSVAGGGGGCASSVWRLVGEDVKVECPSTHVHGNMLATQVLTCHEHLQALQGMMMYLPATREAQRTTGR